MPFITAKARVASRAERLRGQELPSIIVEPSEQLPVAAMPKPANLATPPRAGRARLIVPIVLAVSALGAAALWLLH